MTAEIDPSTPRYEIEPRRPDLGGGWRLRMIENGREVGGAVFPSPADEEANKEAYVDALGEAESWLVSRLETPSP